ncbi:MAG: M23 family metallopeptidase [Alphaproteobacteria bacterium]|nr:M23 family metallopeptidase [Alphaproteobacteria bacterium]
MPALTLHFARVQTRRCRVWAGALAVALVSTGAAGADAPAGFVLQPPVASACISSPFGWRHAVGPHAPAGFHNGIDLPAPAGAEVRAAAAGTVEVIRRHGPGGLWILIRHPDGLSTLYAHLGSLRARFASGQRRVAAGEVLGRVGRSGITYGTHVFFAVFADGHAIDPAPLLGVTRCSR